VVDRNQEASPSTRKASQGRSPGEDRVGVTSTQKLRGYARYLEVEGNAMKPDGTFRKIYTYRVPREDLGRALNAGGRIADGGANETAEAAQPGPGGVPGRRPKGSDPEEEGVLVLS
jgi:hypothetical protein